MNKKRRQPMQNQSRYSPMLIVTIVAGVVLVGLLFYWAGRSDRQFSPRIKSQTDADVPPFFASAEAAQPLPKTLSAELFSDHYVTQAYRAAASIPSVLAQQPCYCHCDRLGHRSLLDCFTTRHGAS